MRMRSTYGVLARAFHIYYRVKKTWTARSADSALARQHRAQFYSDLWHEAARQAGATAEPLGNEVFEIRSSHGRTRVLQNVTALDTAITCSIVRIKPLVSRLLAREGLRTPTYREFTSSGISDAIAFLNSVGTTCVVKPADAGGGEGVTTNVRTPFDVVRAAGLAMAYSNHLIIEQQIPGEVYRLLYLDGELIDAVQRRRPMVVADGTSRVRDLIARENHRRLTVGPTLAHVLVPNDVDLEATLRTQGLTLRSIVPRGQTIMLKTVINDNSQAENVSAAHLLCRSVIEDGARAASLLGIRLAGIDIITTDPTVPLAQSGGAIIEANTTPSYHHHYFKSDGGFPVAVHLLPALFAQSRDAPDAVPSTEHALDTLVAIDRRAS